MPTDLTCTCGKRLRVADEHAGKQGQCPACGRLLQLPACEAGVTGAALSGSEPEEAVTAPTTDRPALPGQAEAAQDRLAPPPGPPHVGLPAYRLHPPGHVGLVALLCGPVGAVLILALNYLRLGRRAAAGAAFASGLLVIAAVTAFSLAWPDAPGLALGLPLALALWVAARAWQGGAYEAHLRRGGEASSGWAAAGLGVLGVALYIGAFMAVFPADNQRPDQRFGQKIDFGGGEEVYYAGGGTEADARALGAFLREAGFFDGRSPKAVRVSRHGEAVIVSFVVQVWVLNDAPLQQEFLALGRQASERAFGGRRVEVRLCDEHFNTKATLR